MTSIVEFLIHFLANVFNLALSLKFELFGHQVSVMSLELGALVVLAFVYFFKNQTVGLMRFSKNTFSRSENRKDKSSEYVPRHARIYSPKHEKKEWFYET